jgi:tRNA (guanine-N7-)-methyltransferase
LAKVFEQHQPLEVELGSGDGGFLFTWASLHPERNFLGVERLLGRLRKLDRKGRRAGLANLRLLRIEASYFLKYLMPPASITALHVYFPDPWPKRRHHKHRLINSEFAQAAARALAAAGQVYIRTDNADYFAHVLSVLEAHPQFEPVETPEVLKGVWTDFEKDFRARGLATLHAAWCLAE